MPGEKLFPCRHFTRVRPFTAQEARIAPADCPIAREIIKWDGGETLTVLDPNNHFSPRKNGSYRVGPVLWSFEDDEVPEVKPVKQSEVYDRVVAPVIPQIVNGYSTAFLVAGGASSGRLYTMYGGDVEGTDRGILFRFSEDIFREIERKKEEDSELTCEMQAIDMIGDTYIDCLAPPPKKGVKETELKLVSSPDGPKLQGAHSVDISGAENLRFQLRKLFLTVGKRNSTHTISLKFTETFEFADPDNQGQPVRKSRRFRVLFALLRNVPAGFARCVQVAVEHDSGENPMAKVPVRESALTRLYPELLMQGYALNVISCVSPFFEHAKEDMNTLSFATKIQHLIGRPKRVQDSSLLEMRRLADEVKDLKTEVRKQNESVNIVQQELNAREMELMKQEEIYQRARENLALAKEDLQIAIIGRNYQVDKSRRARKAIQQELDEEKKAIKALQRELDQQSLKNEAAMRKVDDIDSRTEVLQTRVEREAANEAEYRRRLEVYEAEEKKVEELENFNSAAPEEQERIVRQGYDASASQIVGREKTALEKEKARTAEAAEKVAKAKAAYEKVVEAESAATSSNTKVARIQKEVADTDGEIEKMEAQIAAEEAAAEKRAADAAKKDADREAPPQDTETREKKKEADKCCLVM